MVLCQPPSASSAVVFNPRARHHYVHSGCGRNVYSSAGCQRRHIQQPAVYCYCDHGEHCAGGECRSKPESQRRSARAVERLGINRCERQPAHVHVESESDAGPRKHGNAEQPDIVNPTFTPDVPGTYVAQLIVNDGVVNSQPSTVTISTNAVQAPTANAGPNQSVVPGSTVTLRRLGLNRRPGTTADVHLVVNYSPDGVAMPHYRPPISPIRPSSPINPEHMSRN